MHNSITGNLHATAMAVMPHTDVPLWPQLPNYSYYEDRHVQAAEHFPGIVLDLYHSDRPAIRGQLEGPVSSGFNILDQDERPILFDDTVRPFARLNCFICWRTPSHICSIAMEQLLKELRRAICA